MGDHFQKLADKQDEERGGAPAKDAAEVAAEKRAHAEVQRAMSNPEVAAILQEPAVQAILQKLQAGRSLEMEGEMRDPEMMRKLKVLADAGLIGMHR